jgi:hypothetical protein
MVSVVFTSSVLHPANTSAKIAANAKSFFMLIFSLISLVMLREWRQPAAGYLLPNTFFTG